MVRESKDGPRFAFRPRGAASKALGISIVAVGLLLAGANREDPVERRQRIERMTSQEQAELARKLERYSRLTPEKQAELRRLHEMIEAESDGHELREVMRRYCEWLDTLPESAGYMLRTLPVDKRMEEIAKRRYGPRDVRALAEWWTSHLRELRERHAAESARRDSRAERRDPPERREPSRQAIGPGGPSRFDPWSALRRVRDPDRAVQFLVRQWELDKADLSPLRAQLSKATGEEFDKMTREKQQEWVVEKFLELNREEMRRQMRGRPRVQPTDEQLDEFYHSDAVSDEDREWLMQMPGREMHATLTRWYQMDTSFGRSGSRESRDQQGPREPFPPWRLLHGEGRRDATAPPAGADRRPPGMDRRPPEPPNRDRRPRDGRRMEAEDAPSP